MGYLLGHFSHIWSPCRSLNDWANIENAVAATHYSSVIWKKNIFRSFRHFCEKTTTATNTRVKSCLFHWFVIFLVQGLLYKPKLGLPYICNSRTLGFLGRSRYGYWVNNKLDSFEDKQKICNGYEMTYCFQTLKKRAHQLSFISEAPIWHEFDYPPLIGRLKKLGR
jgi:hypothetical protein